jgi:hypothetical protein
MRPIEGAIMSRPYHVKGLAVHVLNDIPFLFSHPKTTEITQSFTGKTFMCRFPSGQIYYESKLDLDTDVSVHSKQDKTGQKHTSAKDAEGKDLDADLINFFVLPGGFAKKHGIAR